MDISSIVSGYISKILKSKNKKSSIKKIVREIICKYPDDKETVFNELQVRLLIFSQLSKNPPRVRYFSEPSGLESHRKTQRFRARKFLRTPRAQANDDYLEYLALLNDAIKEE